MRAQIARVFPDRELRPFGIDDGDVVLAARLVGRVDERPHDLRRVARRVADDFGDGRRGDHIGQAVAAQQQRRVRLERRGGTHR